jgi:hypothetical protein
MFPRSNPNREDLPNAGTQHRECRRKSVRNRLDHKLVKECATMPFRLNRQPNVSLETPEALFRDLRARKVEGLLSHQADILRAYQAQALEVADVALQLPTGSGKTLVGLLIGEWRRRQREERIVYLCPTKQLVNQVVEQGQTKYGIKANAFIGRHTEYSPTRKAEYLNGEAIAVTTYSALFNVNPFFQTPHIIILDDAHAAESYIADHWSVIIDRGAFTRCFEAVSTLLKPVLPIVDYQRLISPTDARWDTEWVDKVPTPSLYPLIPQLTSLLDTYTAQTDLMYSWSIIRDHLFACQLYLSTTQFLIRPVIPPTKTHSPFADAKQRVYMSATLGSGGDLERITGIETIKRLPIPDGWDKQGIGRRLFFFPERSLKTEEVAELVSDMMKMTPRSLMLVASEGAAKTWREVIAEKTGFVCIDAQEIEQSKIAFVDTEEIVAVIANRYDGIDFVQDECRLLFVDDLPRAVNLQERFMISRMAATVMLGDRIQTRIVQAVGRCTRSATDYAAVVILGTKLSNFFFERERRSFLHPELQAELKFGLEQSRGISLAGFVDNLGIFLKHEAEWNEADQFIISLRKDMAQKALPGTNKLMESVKHEVKYQYAIWQGDYQRAIRECDSLLSILSGDEVKGYRAWWGYLAGSAAWLGAQSGISSLDQVARAKFAGAAAVANLVLWLRGLARLHLCDESTSGDESDLLAVVERLEAVLAIMGLANTRKFEDEARLILDGINSEESNTFEAAHTRLGHFLGYEAGNRETTAAPDPWWIASDKLCFIFEDHSPSQSASAIGANKVRQAASHPIWVRENVRLQPDAEIVAVMISPRRLIDEDAVRYASDVCYWNLDDFRTWAADAVAVVRKVRDTFPGEGYMEWREQTMREYKDAGIDPEQMRRRLECRLLRDLPTAPSQRT